MGGFKILAFQDPEFNILANFKIFVYCKILAFQNPEFKILDDFKIFVDRNIYAFQNPEFKIWLISIFRLISRF